MPYTTIVWGEEQAANGLTGTAALPVTNTSFAASGDKQVFPDVGQIPYIFAFGMTGDTKPQGCNLLPDTSNANKGYYGPGAQVFYPHGWIDRREAGLPPIAIQPRDSITGQTSSTNVNEGSVLGANVSFGSVPAYPKTFPGRQFFQELVTITSGAAVTYNSGAATVYAAATNTTNWYDPEASYYLLGVSGHLSGATFGGICHVTGLESSPGWAGNSPGVPINALSAVDFSSNQPFTPFAQTIGPIKGLALNTTVKLGMTASTAGAVNFVLHMSRA
jgi:hypothetical protein